MSKYLRYPLTLLIVAGFCAAAIALTYSFTNPILVKNQQIKTQETLKKLYPNGKKFTQIFDKTQLKEKDITGVFEVVLPDGTKRFVYETVNKGKNSEIVTLIAFNKDKIEKVVNIAHNETPGIGARIDDKEYLDKIINQNINKLSIDTIAGATYSSSALKKSIESATRHYIEEVRK